MSTLQKTSEYFVPLAVAAATALVICATAFADGGYFPVAWGALGVLFGCACGLRLLVRGSPIEISPPERFVLGSLAALVAWVALSGAWSLDFPQTLLEVQRDLVYPLGVATVLVLGRQAPHAHVLAGVWLGITALCTYSLATRLFPEHLGSFAHAHGVPYRLAEPVGYWNALGILAAMGVLLALGFSTTGSSLTFRALAGASVVVLLPTLYFTFGRSAWAALLFGMVVMLDFSRRRLRLATALAVLAFWPVLALIIASRLEGLSQDGASLPDAARDGRTLALVILGLAPVTGLTAAAVALAQTSLSIGSTTRRRWSVALVMIVIAAASTLVARHGGTVLESLDGRVGRVPLEDRIFNLNSGRAGAWRVAWANYESHPVFGSGAGTFEQYWFQHGPGSQMRDAHNLYLETLSELGPLGLGLLVVALGSPILVAFRVRADPIIAGASGAYSAYLLHATWDFDWEMVAVTLTGLTVGAGLLLGGSWVYRPWRLGRRVRMASLVVIMAFGGFSAILSVSSGIERSTGVACISLAATHAPPRARPGTPYGCNRGPAIPGMLLRGLKRVNMRTHRRAAVCVKQLGVIRGIGCSGSTLAGSAAEMNAVLHTAKPRGLTPTCLVSWSYAQTELFRLIYAQQHGDARLKNA